MGLVQELVWLGNTVGQRYDLVKDIGNVAVEAASCAISLQDPERAIEWLEEGRSIVWNQILQLRTPLSDLAAADPMLAERLERVGRELEQAGSRPVAVSPSTDSELPIEQDAQRHRRLAAEWDQLLKEARQIPTFEDFMQPRRAESLIRVAKDGPVVVIIVHQNRCDALIIRPDSDGIAHVPLENFTLEKALDARTQLASAIGQRGGRARGFRRLNTPPISQDKFKAMLAVLWSDVAKPVLDYLGYTRKLPVQELPRLTWCTTGVLSFLPLHAAGCYGGTEPKLSDLAVSSYTPTLSALLSPVAPASSLCSGVLAVGQESTNGFGNLPYTVHELAAIMVHANETPSLQLDGANATVAAVLKAMDEYSWVHLACHATQNKEDPSQSAFHLHDGGLTLSTITGRSFRNKGLAFLSACQTASGDEKLPDEAVHLAAGMLMAGYPSIIATMWAIQDTDGPQVARGVYADLLKDGKMDYTEASRALHQAVAGLRDMVGECSFDRWVPFIHIGS